LWARLAENDSKNNGKILEKLFFRKTKNCMVKKKILAKNSIFTVACAESYFWKNINI